MESHMCAKLAWKVSDSADEVSRSFLGPRIDREEQYWLKLGRRMGSSLIFTILYSINPLSHALT